MWFPYTVGEFSLLVLLSIFTREISCAFLVSLFVWFWYQGENSLLEGACLGSVPSHFLGRVCEELVRVLL